MAEQHFRCETCHRLRLARYFHKGSLHCVDCREGVGPGGDGESMRGKRLCVGCWELMHAAQFRARSQLCRECEALQADMTVMDRQQMRM